MGQSPQLIAAMALAGGLFSCANDVRDAQCTPDSFEFALDPDCPYKASQGPQVPQVKCRAEQEEAGNAPTWQQIFEVFTDKGRGNCSDSGCHGKEETAAVGVFIPGDDPTQAYLNLTETTGSIGTPYINTNSPSDSWIHCNVRGTEGGGFPMPKPAGMPTVADADLVEDWVLIGAPKPSGL